MVTCIDAKETKSSWAPRGTLMGQSTLYSGDESDSSAHERGMPGGAGGLCLGTRASSSGGVASSGSDAVNSLGTVTPTGGSALGISNGTVPLEVGATGSLSATSNISRSIWSPSSNTEVGHLWRSCTALQNIPGGIAECMTHLLGPWSVPLFLHTTPPDNSEFLWNPLGEGNPASQYPQEEWDSPQAIFLELCGWQPEGSSLLVGQPLGLDLTHTFVLRAEERLKFSPPFRHSIMVL